MRLDLGYHSLGHNIGAFLRLFSVQGSINIFFALLTVSHNYAMKNMINEILETNCLIRTGCSIDILCRSLRYIVLHTTSSHSYYLKNTENHVFGVKHPLFHLKGPVLVSGMMTNQFWDLFRGKKWGCSMTPRTH